MIIIVIIIIITSIAIIMTHTHTLTLFFVLNILLLSSCVSYALKVGTIRASTYQSNLYRSARHFSRLAFSTKTRAEGERAVSRLYAATPGKDAEEWFGCKVVSNVADGEGLRLIDISVTDPSVAAAFSNPGQYLKLKTDSGVDTKPSFLAIASPPQQKDTFQFLIKETENNGALTSALAGMEVFVTSPMGNGYKIEESFESYRNDFPVNNVLLMACGSGIAPICSAIESGKLSIGEVSPTTIFPRTATLYIGARSQAHLPLSSRYKRWEEEFGIKVVPVLSQETGDYSGAKGYIQDKLKEDTINVPKNTGALLCGMKGMTDSVKQILLDSGVYEGRILFNF